MSVFARSPRRPVGEFDRYVVALASLGAGPKRLRGFLDFSSPKDAWEAIAMGAHPADGEGRYRAKAGPRLLASAAAACERSGASVLVRGQIGYPASLAGDADAPPVLFGLGNPGICDGAPRVALVGTRSATEYGLAMGRELGRDLAEAGVVVVSGLARGVDCAAHDGALRAPVAGAFGVLGAAIDAPLSVMQAQVREGLSRKGAVVSEIPPGIRGAPRWWFAVRNRVIAAMSHVVIVVECHQSGGALHTVRYARDRAVAVGAVPGSVRSAASDGTNGLLVEGAAVVRHADDVLSLLATSAGARAEIGHSGALRAHTALKGRIDRMDARHERVRHLEEDRIDGTSRRVLEALSQDPAPLDTLVGRVALSLGEVAFALERLSELGLARSEGGWWSSVQG